MWKSDKIRTFLSKKRNIYIIYIIVSICILFLALGGKSEKAPPEKTEPAATELETVLEAALSRMQGVENPTVCVTFDTSTETVAAKNRNGDSETVVTLGSGSGAHLAAEKEIMPRVRGVVVVARGAENPSVRADIFACVQALSGADAHAIGIFPSK